MRTQNEFKQDILLVGEPVMNETEPKNPSLTAQMKQSALSGAVNYQPPMLPHRSGKRVHRESSYQARLSNAGQAYQSSLLTRFIK